VESDGNNMYIGQPLFDIPRGSCGVLQDPSRMHGGGTDQRSTVDGIVHGHRVYYKQFHIKM